MRRRRTIYHNDARHSYLWHFEPPMRLEDAWIPIDEVAGTAVDTFSYCVERGDGAFYPTKVGKMFAIEDGKPQSKNNYEWRAAACMLSLMERGLDPLRVLVDRAHEHGLDFIADLRLQRLGGMYPELEIEHGGAGWAEERVRDLKYDVLRELATEYPIQGVELDFTAAFSESGYFYFNDGGTPENTAAMTEWVRRSAEMVRSRPGEPSLVGARIFPTEQGNLEQGLDVRTWLGEGLLDFVVPVAYVYTVLDPDMPFDWVVGPAHDAGASVYGFLQHYTQDNVVGASGRRHPNLEHFRAAAANYWEKGVDGLYHLDDGLAPRRCGAQHPHHDRLAAARPRARQALCPSPQVRRRGAGRLSPPHPARAFPAPPHRGPRDPLHHRRRHRRGRQPRPRDDAAHLPDQRRIRGPVQYRPERTLAGRRDVPPCLEAGRRLSLHQPAEPLAGV